MFVFPPRFILLIYNQPLSPSMKTRLRNNPSSSYCLFSFRRVNMYSICSRAECAVAFLCAVYHLFFCFIDPPPRFVRPLFISIAFGIPRPHPPLGVGDRGATPLLQIHMCISNCNLICSVVTYSGYQVLFCTATCSLDGSEMEICFREAISQGT